MRVGKDIRLKLPMKSSEGKGQSHLLFRTAAPTVFRRSGRGATHTPNPHVLISERTALGTSGTGKSHLLIALSTEAAMAGYRVRYTLATKLVNELVEAADDKQLTKTIARYGRIDLLCVDELGYMETDRRSAELLFQVLTEREEKASVAIASNESFSKAHMFQRTCERRRRNLTSSRTWCGVLRLASQATTA
jgi:hypothetical protein